jgi:cell division septation protein DedD
MIRSRIAGCAALVALALILSLAACKNGPAKPDPVIDQPQQPAPDQPGWAPVTR